MNKKWIWITISIVLVLALGASLVLFLPGIIGKDKNGADACKHEWSYWVEIERSTCTHEGLVEKTCKNCGAKQQDVKPRTQHNLDDAQDVVQATCTQAGRRTGICKDCYQTVVLNIEPLGHNFSASYTIDRTASCTEPGEQSQHCTRDGCGEKRNVSTIAPSGHNYQMVLVKSATSCAPGGEGERVQKCTKCNHETGNREIVIMEHTWGDYYDIHQATCTVNGYQTHSCTVCSDTETVAILKTGHDFEGSFTVDVEPTCTATGTKSRPCSRCAETETMVIPALGHAFETNFTTDTEPTCTAVGSKSKHCSRCAEVSETTVISALGHAFETNFTIDTEPTCTAVGSKSKHCSRCSELSEITAISALGHSWGAWTPKDENEHQHTCSTCDDVETGAHVMSGSRCTICEWTVLPTSFTITWKNYDGTELEKDIGVTQGTTPSYDGETPTRPENEACIYLFDGWSPTIEPVTGDATYTAQYTSYDRVYTITWNNDDNTTLRTESLVYGDIPSYGATPTKTATESHTYTFSGWSPTVEPVTGDATYTAQFTPTPKTFTITYYNQGESDNITFSGTIIGKKDTYTYGETYNINSITPTRSGYEFGGWFTTYNGTTTAQNITATTTGNITFYAKWIHQTLTVSFDIRTSQVSTPEPITLNFGEPYEFSSHKISYPGYLLDGWWTEPTGGTQIEVGKTIVTTTGTQTLYAHWKPCTHSYGNWNSISNTLHRRTCSWCDSYQEQEHDGVWYIEHYPTCNDEGSKIKQCSICGSTQSEDIPATGAHLYEKISTEATCTTGGNATYECTVCGDEVETWEDPSGHVYGDWYTFQSPTCTQPGILRQTCENCGDHISQSISSLGHTPSGNYSGYLEGHYDICGRCEGIFNFSGHTWFEGECSACHEMCNHAHIDTNSQQPTCTESGFITEFCVTCGIEISSMELPPAHNFDTNGICENCGAHRTEHGWPSGPAGPAEPTPGTPSPSCTHENVFLNEALNQWHCPDCHGNFGEERPS